MRRGSDWLIATVINNERRLIISDYSIHPTITIVNRKVKSLDEAQKIIDSLGLVALKWECNKVAGIVWYTTEVREDGSN